MGSTFKIQLDTSSFSPKYKNRFHKFLCRYLPSIFKPTANSVLDTYDSVKLVVLSEPKQSKERFKNPWYKFWLPRYSYSGVFIYEVKILEDE